MRTTLIIDGSNMIYRCLLQEGLGFMYSKKGRSSGATYGSISILRKLLREHTVTSVVFVQDGGLSKRRLEIFPEYKGKRRAAREKARALIESGEMEIPSWKDRWVTTVGGKMKKCDLDDPQWRAALSRAFTENADDLREALPHLGVRIVSLKGREADDVVARIALDKSMSGDQAIIVSEDRDFVQLVDERIMLCRPIADQYINETSFPVYIKVPKWFYLMSRAIEGDDSDEIPGVHGVGEKTILKIAELIGDPAVSEADLFTLIERVCLDFQGDKRTQNFMAKAAAGIAIMKRNVALMDLRIESNTLSAYEEDKLYTEMEKPVSLNIDAVVKKLKTLDATSTAAELNISGALDFQCLEG